MQLNGCFVLMWMACLLVNVVLVQCQLTPQEKQKILDQHNSYRSQVARGLARGNDLITAANMVLMGWDDIPAQKSQIWAEQCVQGHDDPTPRLYANYTSVGQNVAYWAPATDYPAEYAVKAWFDEIDTYNYTLNTCSDVCGHYTQVVWYNSAFIGCGIARKCMAAYNTLSAYSVCEYAPAGNWNGNRPFLQGEVCSACPFGYSKCMAGLCATEEQCNKAGYACTDSQVDPKSGVAGWVSKPTNVDSIIARVPAGDFQDVTKPTPLPAKITVTRPPPGAACADSLSAVYCTLFATKCNTESVRSICAKSCKAC